LKPTRLSGARLLAAAGRHPTGHTMGQSAHGCARGHRTCIACGRAGHVARGIICLTTGAPRREVIGARGCHVHPALVGTTELHVGHTQWYVLSVPDQKIHASDKSWVHTASQSPPDANAVAGADTRAGVLVGCRARRRRACAWQSRVGWLSRGWVGCGRPSAVLAVKRAYSGWGKAGGLFNVHEPTTRGTSRVRYNNPGLRPVLGDRFYCKSVVGHGRARVESWHVIARKSKKSTHFGRSLFSLFIPFLHRDTLYLAYFVSRIPRCE
jgi:hypothetical protein